MLWLETTIAEPFPVLFGHVDEDTTSPDYNGPKYEAGSQWYDLPAAREFVDWRANGIRKRGYTITVKEVWR